jgi:hypothetical protein
LSVEMTLISENKRMKTNESEEKEWKIVWHKILLMKKDKTLKWLSHQIQKKS